MILIFGGVYQGKLEYALDRFNADVSDIYKCSDEETAVPQSKKIIYEIDRWVLALIKAEADITTNVRSFIENNEDAVVISNDISCGIVPSDETSRRWREEAGRVMALVAQQSEEVVRVFCGVPSRIK